MNGVINVYKEKGFTSFDVVAKLRGILKTKKIGHTGTLDPQAEGVLPVCIGTATGLCDMLTQKDKVYETVLLLGTKTDTQDITGTVLSVSNQIPETEKILDTIKQFITTYEQLPPMYSAIKVNGRRLYELAREGKEVKRTPRKVTIEQIQVNQISEKEVSMRVFCSKGTYIRTLCKDIGDRLGCGGCMKQLVRIKSGMFTIEESHRISEIETLVKEQRWNEILIPTDYFLPYPAYTVRKEKEKLLLNGNPLAKRDVLKREQTAQEVGKVRMYLPEGEFVGVYEWKPEKNRYDPVKMFLSQT